MIMMTALAAAVTVAQVLGEYRQLQGSDKAHNVYTEVHDTVMNRVIERDREVEAEWMEAAKDPAAFKAKQEAVRKAWIESIGGFPERCPLNVKVTGVVKRDGYRVEKTMFESRPGHHVTADVFVPEDPAFKAPYPAVAVACGHSVEGKMIANYQRPGVIGAKNGFVVIVYDPIDQGERLQRRDAEAWKSSTVHGHNNVGYRAMLLGWNTAQFRIWDGMRAIDVLCEREDVDREHIAVTGHSGGGTESSYIMALDDRVKAACPSGFITTVREVVYLCGPQDAEQKFYNQLNYGLDHLAILLLRADRCAEMPLTTHADFFPFNGATHTRDQARRAYEAIGRKEAFDFVHATGPHLWPESSQQAEFRWFRKWLKGEDVWKGYDAVAEQKVNVGFSYEDPGVDIGLKREKDNLTTPTGKVVDLEGERTVYDIMREEAVKAAAARGGLSPEAVAKAAGIRTAGLSAEALDRKECEVEGAKAVSISLYRNDDGVILPVKVFKTSGEAKEAAFIVSDTLKPAELAGKVEAEIKAGRPVVVAELRQFGRTGQEHRRHGENWSKSFYGCPDIDEMTAVIGELVGDSILARRTEDMLLIADAARGELGREVVFAVKAEGRASIPAAHAYYLGAGRFGSFEMEKAPASWARLFEDDRIAYRFADVIHGAYRVYDWADLVR